MGSRMALETVPMGVRVNGVDMVEWQEEKWSAPLGRADPRY
jgi:hypothetical protein